MTITGLYCQLHARAAKLHHTKAQKKLTTFSQLTWDLHYHFWYASRRFLRDQKEPLTSLPPGWVAVSDSAKKMLNKTYSYVLYTTNNSTQTHRLKPTGHSRSSLMCTDCVVSLKVDWAIFCSAGSGGVGRAWSARDISLDILCDGWELKQDHEEDRQWDTFLFPLSYHDWINSPKCMNSYQHHMNLRGQSLDTPQQPYTNNQNLTRSEHVEALIFFYSVSLLPWWFTQNPCCGDRILTLYYCIANHLLIFPSSLHSLW